MASRILRARLLSLPLEIRLEIYRYLLEPERAISDELSRPLERQNLTPLCIRTLSPARYENRKWRQAYKRRSKYYGHSKRSNVPYLTTYYVIPARFTYASILRVNRQIYSEAIPILYSSYTMDFERHVEAVQPFLSDLFLSTSSIRYVAITKRASPFEKESHRADWKTACHALAKLPQLQELTLNVIASKPRLSSHDIFSPMDRIEMVQMFALDSFQWTRDLSNIEKLKKLHVYAHIEKCPVPKTDALWEWVRFSENIEGSFREVLNSILIESQGNGGTTGREEKRG
ncbi:MAG: hypothetical protein M1820_009146 [Bogoriella megaspora]|nr:MAG: hypothetical protein M1820_009146 [Bogoriella megaspora]